MAFKFSTAVRNARLDAIETTISTAPVLTIRTGSPPADCAAANTGTVLATFTLPSNWMGDAASGVKSKAGTWSDASADATGTAGHFRIHESTATTCHIQGTITATGLGGDMTLNSTTITSGDTVTISAFGLTDGNA